ncbi:MAG: tetratricopeptide repeat protein, partial [Planctomycetota bacterium]
TLALQPAEPEPETPPIVVDDEAVQRLREQLRPDGPQASGNEIELAAAARRLLEAAYLTVSERAQLRIKHGQWTEADLAEPALAARIALTVGDYDNAAFDDAAADPLDRAEAMIARGDIRDALELIDRNDTMRAHRLRAEAHETLGQFDAALAATEPIVAFMRERSIDDADELVDAVLGLMVRNRVGGPGLARQTGTAAADFRAMMAMLARARDELDRLSWRANLVEAQLLAEKMNPSAAQEAAVRALELNPKAAQTWSLLGTMAVRYFDFDRAESIAEQLDDLSDAPSVYSQLISAHARLRQNDRDGALELADAALEQFPRHRAALAMRAAAIASDFDDARTEAVLAAFDDINGNTQSPQALQAVGGRLSEARQYDEARVMLRRAAERQPNHPEPLIELGLMELQAGRDVAAIDALREATRLDPFNVRAANSLSLAQQLITWPTDESDHFVVRYRDGIDELLAREMLPTLDTIHERLAEKFEHEPDRKTLIELMPDHATFAVRITGMPAIHTVAAATGPVIAMESPQSGPGFSIGVYDWSRTLQHEYAHTVTLSRTRNRIPHWFTEAAAVWAEDRPRPPSWWTLLTAAFNNDALFDLDEISLRFVRPIRPQDRTQAYAQGHWMYEYMVERFGRRAPLALMDRYAAGESQGSAFEAEFGISPDTFFTDFKAWAKSELIERGLVLAEGVPTLEEIQTAAAVQQAQRDRLADMRDRDARDPLDLMRAMADADGDAATEPTADELDAWLADHPGHPQLLRARLSLALDETRGRPTPEQADLLERVAEATPEDPMPHRLLARLALDGSLPGAPERALEHLEFLAAREIYSPVYARALAERYAGLRNMDAALRWSRKAVTIAPFDAQLREYAARIALQAGKGETALAHLEALTMIEPGRDIHQRRLDALRARLQ